MKRRGSEPQKATKKTGKARVRDKGPVGVFVAPGHRSGDGTELGRLVWGKPGDVADLIGFDDVGRWVGGAADVAEVVGLDDLPFGMWDR